jgi:hypothetical protein
MFVAVALACGLDIQNMFVVRKCGLLVHKIPSVTEIECNRKLVDLVDSNPMPKGAYITDAKCVKLASGKKT